MVDPAFAGLRVTVVSGPDAQSTFAPSRRAVLIGRSEGADVKLGDPAVSPFHVEIAMVQRGIEVRALDSTSPVAHAGARIERAVIPAGGLLDLGRSVLRVDTVLESGPTDPPRWDRPTFGALRGTSPAMRALFVELDRLTRKESSVLIEGASGSGKTIVSRAIHAISKRAGGVVLHLDCATLPTSLVERGLFGALAGTELGTLILDEIDALPPAAQTKLAFAWDRGEVKSRVIASSSRNLCAQVNRGDFRDDLHRRIAHVRIRLPPLDERPEDIALLAQHFLSELPSELPCARAISSEALTELARRHYPENVRGLRETIERVAQIADGDVIFASDLAFERILSRRHLREPSAAPEFERGCLERLLMRAGGGIGRAAAVACVDRESLRALLQRHGLRGEE